MWRRAVLAAALAAVAAAQSTTVTVTTPLGPVTGVRLDDGSANVFLGVPYATQPVGPLRWQPPQPATPWGPSAYQATSDPPGCIQLCQDGLTEPPHICPVVQTEACLLLNIWTPTTATPASKLPVLMFIHGGNFKNGFAGGLKNGLLYDGRQLANRTDTIFVAINYRLGSMGFLYGGPSTTLQGNYGLMDQEMAMRWLQANVAAFGGDPARITISGQSAGAQSVAAHLTRPSEMGLYAGAIMHSAPFALPFRTPAAGLELLTAMAGNADCSGNGSYSYSQMETCLRGLSSAAIIAAQIVTETDLLASLDELLNIFEPFPPTVGTAYLPFWPLDAFQAGIVNDVPIMLGTVANESNLFIDEAFTQPVGETEFYIFGGIIIGLNRIVPVLEYYPVPNPVPADLRPLLIEIGSDALFTCAVRNATASAVASASRKSPMYLWRYDHVLAANPGIWGNNFTECWNVVCHAEDLPQLYSPNLSAFGYNYTAPEVLLSTQMQWYWANFAATGNPGSGYSGAPVAWPAFTQAAGRPLMYLQTGSPKVVTAYEDSQCALWDSLGYNLY